MAGVPELSSARPAGLPPDRQRGHPHLRGPPVPEPTSREEACSWDLPGLRQSRPVALTHDLRGLCLEGKPLRNLVPHPGQQLVSGEWRPRVLSALVRETASTAPRWPWPTSRDPPALVLSTLQRFGLSGQQRRAEGQCVPSETAGNRGPASIGGLLSGHGSVGSTDSGPAQFGWDTASRDPGPEPATAQALATETVRREWLSAAAHTGGRCLLCPPVADGSQVNPAVQTGGPPRKVLG